MSPGAISPKCEPPPAPPVGSDVTDVVLLEVSLEVSREDEVLPLVVCLSVYTVTVSFEVAHP